MMPLPKIDLSSRIFSEKFFVSFIFITAFLLRLAYTFFLEHNYFFVHYPSDDVPYYQNWAHEIASGNWIGNKVFSGMPLYPYFLAVLERLTLGNLFLIRLIHLLLGSINVCLVYWLAKKIFSSFNIAFLSGILAATNFILIYYDWLMMPVTLIIFLSLIIALALVSLDIYSPGRQWVITGVFIGLGMLADGKFAFVAIGAVIYLLSFHKTKLTLIAKKILFPLLAGILIVLSLVTLRNRLVSNDWVFISAHSGINFYLGNNPQATGIFNNPAFLRPLHEGHENDPQIIAEIALNKELKPSEVSKFWVNKSLAFIKNSPTTYLKLLKKKAATFFTENDLASDIDLILQKSWKDRLDVNPFFVLCPLAILGIFLNIRRQPNSYGLAIFVISQFIFTLIFFLVTRHRATILPFLLIFESFAVFWMVQQIQRRNYIPLLSAGIICVAFFFLFRPIALNQQIIDFIQFTKSGYILAQQKDHNRAQEQYLKALRLQPFDSGTLYNLGNSYMEQGKFDQAISVYQKASTLNPYDVDVLYNLAYAHEQKKDSESAILLYTKVLALMPESVDAQYRLANIYLAKGECSPALVYLKKITQNHPQFAAEILPLIEKCKP